LAPSGMWGHLISYQHFGETCCYHFQCLRVEAVDSPQHFHLSTRAHIVMALLIYIAYIQTKRPLQNLRLFIVPKRQFDCCQADGAKWGHHTYKESSGINNWMVSFITTTTTAIELSLGGSSPYTSTEKTNENKYT